MNIIYILKQQDEILLNTTSAHNSAEWSVYLLTLSELSIINKTNITFFVLCYHGNIMTVAEKLVCS
jgi:hypothetical protein